MLQNILKTHLAKNEHENTYLVPKKLYPSVEYVTKELMGRGRVDLELNKHAIMLKWRPSISLTAGLGRLIGGELG